MGNLCGSDGHWPCASGNPSMPIKYKTQSKEAHLAVQPTKEDQTTNADTEASSAASHEESEEPTAPSPLQLPKDSHYSVKHCPQNRESPGGHHAKLLTFCPLNGDHSGLRAKAWVDPFLAMLLFRHSGCSPLLVPSNILLPWELSQVLYRLTHAAVQDMQLLVISWRLGQIFSSSLGRMPHTCTSVYRGTEDEMKPE